MKTNKAINCIKAIFFCAAVAAATGCQTRITATKHAEVAHPVHKVVQVNGEDKLIVDHYQVTSGGWDATARSPLYATEALSGLELGVETNGSVRLSLNSYNRDLSTNSVVMVKEMFSGGAQLAIAIGEAYTKIAGGGAQADTALSVANKVYKFFTDKGGDASKATVSTGVDKLTVSDGSTCVACDAAGNCTDCAPTKVEN